MKRLGAKFELGVSLREIVSKSQANKKHFQCSTKTAALSVLNAQRLTCQKPRNLVLLKCLAAATCCRWHLKPLKLEVTEQQQNSTTPEPTARARAV